MSLTLDKVKKDPQVRQFVAKSNQMLEKMGYTDHGQRHSELVAKRSREIAAHVGLPVKEQELSAIAGFCHDMGNFLGRTQHHYWGALLFHQVFSPQTDDIEGVAVIMQAIVNHDKEVAKIMDGVSAAVILADKSDVSRSRVLEKSIAKIKNDIHDRVNYAVTDSSIKTEKGRITLKITIDTKIVPVMEYFEIFTERMSYCRKAAEFLGHQFGLEINNFKLL